MEGWDSCASHVCLCQMLSAVQRPEVIVAYLKNNAHITASQALLTFRRQVCTSAAFGHPQAWQACRFVGYSHPGGVRVNSDIDCTLSSLSYVSVDPIRSLGQGALFTKIDIRKYIQVLFKALGAVVAHSICQNGIGFPYFSQACYWYMVSGEEKPLHYIRSDDSLRYRGTKLRGDLKGTSSAFQLL